MTGSATSVPVWEAVDWGVCFDALFGGATAEVRATAAAYGRRGPDWCRGQTVFAGLTANSEEDVVRALLGAELAEWARTTARAWTTAVASMGPPPVRPEPPEGSGLYLDPEFVRCAELDLTLPLLGALVEQHGRVAVLVVDDLPDDIAAACRFDAPCFSIEFALRTTWRWADVTLPVWFHELGHAFDPRRDRRPADEHEAFADALAVHLRELPADAPLSVITPLAESVYDAVRTVYGGRTARVVELDQAEVLAVASGVLPGPVELPAPGRDSVAAWLVLKVGVEALR